MSSVKEVFLTRVDEAALSAALRAKFPGICFYTTEAPPKPRFRFFRDIASADTEDVEMAVLPPDWNPNVANERKGFRFDDVTKQILLLQRSSQNVENQTSFVTMEGSRLHVGSQPTMTQAQRSLADRIWRLLADLGTYRLARLDPRCAWRPVPDKMFFAGNDAVRWALGHEERRFEGNYRPMQA